MSEYKYHPLIRQLGYYSSQLCVLAHRTFAMHATTFPPPLDQWALDSKLIAIDWHGSHPLYITKLLETISLKSP